MKMRISFYLKCNNQTVSCVWTVQTFDGPVGPNERTFHSLHRINEPLILLLRNLLVIGYDPLRKFVP